MNSFRKVLVMILSIFLAVIAVPRIAVALPTTLYQESSIQTITAGAVLENISRFTINGWLNIKVLRIDTEEPNIKIDTLANNQTIDKLSTTLSLAEKNGAVAAINSSFFNPMAEGTGYPDGPIVRGGDLLSTSAWYNKNKNEMASFSLDNSNQMLFNYRKNNLTLVDANNTSFAVSQYNKPSRQEYNDITVLDNKWGPFTLGTSEKYPDLLEILVAEGRVTEVRQALPATTMPPNGFTIVSRGTQATKLLENFGVGDLVEFSITSSPNWSSLKMSATGASILVKDGQIPETFSYSIGSFNQRNPRTLAGSSPDGKELILVTVDGRQDNSLGLTQTEAAELMLELGAYQALIFDGGGSTTMVARQPGTTTLQVVNIPSEGGILRKITTGIGVFSIAAPGSLAKLILETEDPNVFVNTSRNFTLRGVDTHFNPVEIDPHVVQWSVSGIKGSFNGNMLHAASVGNGKVTAKVGELTAELDITSLSNPAKLVLSSSLFDLPLGQSKSLQVTGYNQQGYSAKIDPQDVKWAVNGEIGTCENGTFTATATGTGYLDASIGDVHTYCAVAISSDFTDLKYSFEEDNASFLADPQKVRGSFQLAAEQAHDGKTSGQLIYDFYDNNKPEQVSLAFLGKGIPLDPATSQLAVWLYNTHENSNRILGEVLDSTGVKHNIEFSANLNWLGWKEIKASLEKIKTPAYLTRLYVENTDPIVRWGKIYFDDLSATVINRPIVDLSQIPQDTVPQDHANQQISFTSGPNSFRFSVFGSSQEPRNALESQLTKKIAKHINENLDMAVFTGAKAAQTARDIKKPTLSTETEYKTYDYKNSTFIQLDMSKGGLRRSSPEQWTWLFKELDNIKGSNAFIIMSEAPATFINSKEADLLKNTLADYQKKTNKNVWVFHQGKENQSKLDRGVRYISCAGFDAADFTKNKPDAAQYLLVTVIGDSINFEFKPL